MFLLQANGKMTANQLADRLNVSRRTILRDVDALCIAGVPLITEDGYGGGIYLDEAYRVSLTGLNPDEIRALFVSSAPGPLADLGLEQAAENTLLKLLSSLPSLHHHIVDQVQQRFYIDPSWWWHDSKSSLQYLTALQQGVYENRCVRVTYERGSGEIVERTLEPYGLVAKASVWYLVARRDDEYRTYRVERFQSVFLTEGYFQRRNSFDLVEYWGESTKQFVAEITYYEFVISIPLIRLQFLKWHVSGRYEIIDPLPSEKITVRVRLNSLDAARMLVLGLGSETEIISPPELKEAVIRAARSFL